MKPSPVGGLRAPVSPKLADPVLERVRFEHHDAIVRLQQLPAAGLRVLPGIVLADGVPTSVAHGLGRAPAWVSPSAPRGAVTAGRIDDVRDGSHDPTKVVVLKASGFGASITVDVAVL